MVPFQTVGPPPVMDRFQPARVAVIGRPPIQLQPVKPMLACGLATDAPTLSDPVPMDELQPMPTSGTLNPIALTEVNFTLAGMRRFADYPSPA